MTEVEILEKEIGGIKIKDMTTMHFLRWLTTKIDGVSGKTADVIRLTQRVSTPPMGTMAKEEKIDLVKSLIRLGIEIK